jgi:hypothetical protein
VAGSCERSFTVIKPSLELKEDATSNARRHSCEARFNGLYGAEVKGAGLDPASAQPPTRKVDGMNVIDLNAGRSNQERS